MTGSVFASDGVVGAAAGLPRAESRGPALATGSSLGVSAAAGAGGGAVNGGSGFGPPRARSRGSSPAWASSRCSGVGVHRQWRSDLPSPVTPPVRTRVNSPQASRVAATIEMRRGPVERRRLAAAHATRPRLMIGMEKMGNILLIPAFAMDGWTICFVANTATTITTMAPTRSDQGARLKNTHHRTIANPPTTPPNIPKMANSGMTMGTATMASNISTAAATPGHSRSGFRGVGSLDWFVISDCLSCADAHDAAKGPSDADAPEPIQHDHDRHEHRNREKSRDADHLRDSAWRAKEK